MNYFDKKKICPILYLNSCACITTRNFLFTCGFWFPAKTFVGNCFLQFLKSARNLPAEFPAKNEDETEANGPADNPQVILQQYPQVIPQETHFRI
jgi:hypothetical protein